MTTGEVRQIERAHGVPDIEAWFFALLEKAQRWSAWRTRHDELRDRSLSSLAFPFTPREGQRQIMGEVATTIHAGRSLYVQAPTGSGKTAATLYPALKAIGEGEATRVAFLTAKTMTRGPVLECIDQLRRQDFAANVLVMTARDKICPLRKDPRGAQVRGRPLTSLCNPVECPLARRHFDAVNDALFEAISTYDVLDSGSIGKVAARHHVCPYELQRDAALWSDIIICDYHYAFAPSASLIGLADEPGEDTIFLVDEVHNLPERMREMYSAELSLADLKGLERLLRSQGALAELTAAVRVIISAFPAWQQASPANARRGARGGRSQASYQVVRMNDAFEESLAALADGVDGALELLSPAMDEPRADRRGSTTIELFLALRDMKLEVLSFLGALRRGQAGYVTFLGRDENGGRKLKVFCMDPSHDLKERLDQAKAAIFFSGTLLPMGYHRKLLAAQDEDRSVYALSSFDPSHQQVLIASDVSARYSQRGPELNDRIAAYLRKLIDARPSNHLVFLPSYAMVEEVARSLGPLMDGRTRVVRQHPGMREDDRDRFVAQFREARDAGTSLVGLCVLGGIFGESIDLPGDALVGVVVVGTGMPRATGERELIRDYYDVKERKGFAYAYTYPGMIKVLQAAGRLIRTENDRGVVLLLDDRFLERELQEAFPPEWKNVQTCTLKTLAEDLQYARHQ